MMTFIVVVVVLIVISGKVQQHLCLTATFHGSGYASTDWKESSAETHLTFDLLTSHSEATLLIGSGGRDSLVVTLREGVLLVRVDLGSGEALLSSPSGLALNDLRWHTVQFSRYYGNVTLIVDGHYLTSGKTPGVLGDLNLDGAIFLGGAGSDDALLNPLPSSVTLPKPFRGCFRDVIMNGVNLLAKAKRNQFKGPTASSTGITWDSCRPEITSSSDKEIFFPHNNSFVAFPTLNLRVECRVSLEVKVHANSAMLVYASGSKVESDFLALEIVVGAVQVKINKGSGLIKLTNKEKRVNDGAWHTVSLQVDTRRIILAVDDAVSEEIISQSGPATWTLDVDEPLYVGGIGAARRPLDVRQRFDSLPKPRESSLIGGCIRRIYLNDHHFGWREALDSNNVEPVCPVNQGPCGSKDELAVPSKLLGGPCIKGASCVELDWNRFRCECPLPDWSMCYKKNSAPYVMDRNDGAVDEGIVFETDDVSLVEGGLVTLNSSVIAVPRVILLDESLKNLLFFKVVLQPKHGTISKQEDGRGGSRQGLVISLEDIFQDRIRYLHDGSETEDDQVGFLADLRDLDQGRMDFQTWLTDGDFEEELHRLEKIWPPAMRPQNFSINFRINLINDPPSIEIVEQLEIVVDTQRTVTRELLNATDPDDPPDKLEWKVFYSYSSPQQVDIGYFEMEDSLSGKVRSRVTRFTQDDIDRGRVRFVHRGTERQNIGLQLSDGKDKSEVKNLVIRAEPQFIRPMFNTGINIIGWGGASLITSANLTFTSNLSPLTSDHIRYEMIDPPRVGFIQRRRMRQSKKRRQRKKQRQQKQQQKTPDYLFDNHDDGNQGRTGQEESRPFDSPTNEKRKGKFKGRITVRSEYQGDDEDTNHVVDDDDDDDVADWEIVRLFTQAQIDNGLVRYLHYQDPEDDMSHYLEEGDDYPDYPNVDNEFGYPQASGPLHDWFKFKVGVLGRESDEFDFAIRIILPPSLVMVSNGPLIYRLHDDSLPEVAITSGHLLFSSDDLEPRVEPRDIIYRLMTSPKLGSLLLRVDNSTPSGETLRVDSTFTQFQVNQGLVAYRLSEFFQTPLSGDDEALTDDFLLSVSCQDGAPVEFMFKVIISSRSDSHLAEGNGKTGREPDHVIVEEFGEASINTALWDFIEEARTYVENADSEEDMEGTEIRILEPPKYGRLVMLGESSADEQDRDIGISVAEVESSKLVYRHDKGGSSEDMFSFVLIKEGRPFYDVSHVYIGIVPPVMPLHVQPIQVAEGGLTHLNSDHVNVGESHYCKMKVEMLLVVPPKHGRLSMNKSLKEFNQFSLDDIKYGRITYQHDDSETTSDWMMLMARTSLIGKQSKPQLLLVEITPVDDQSPQLVNNRPISIYPGKTVNLTGDTLRVEDKDSTPNDVTYDVGYYQHFELGRFQTNGSDVTKFTQEEIDANLVTIRISDVLPSPKLHNFPISVSDVSNNRLRIAMDFHVEAVRLEFVSMETVRAFPGVLQPITNDSLKIFTSSEKMNHLIGRLIIEVTKKPIHGRIVIFKNDQSLADLDSFKYSLVQSSSIFYISNPENDTSLADIFSFRASLNNDAIVQGQVEICTSLENINRQNSHYLLTIQPLEVREGERAKFTKDNLDVSKLVSILKSRRHIRQMESVGKPDEGVEVKLIISSLPVHGWLTLNGENLTERFEETNFLEIRQSDIDGGYLQYQHDDSESLMDSMEISFEMPSDKSSSSNPSCPPQSSAIFRTVEKPPTAGSEFHTLSTPLTFHIHITPYNDHHFRLLTSAPRAQVIQNGWVVLDSSVLLAEDLDTPPNQIVYKITDRATNGRLVYVNTTNIMASTEEFWGGIKIGRNFFSENNVPSVERFSQSDVNGRRIWFLHDGSDFQPGSIYFSLFEDVDKKFLKNQKVESNILYKALKIDVTPLELKILRAQTLTLTQGNYARQLRPEDFQIMTNTPDPAEDISFEISKNFHHGQMLLEEKAASKFFLRDLQRGSVRYVLTKVDSSSDDALMTISDSSNILLDIQIRVSIRINVALPDSPVQVIQKNGHWFKLNLTHLNASSLAELTGDDPIYRVIEGPTRGKLRRLNKDDLSFIRSTRPRDKRLEGKSLKRDVDSLWFKHSDVLVGNLEYRPYPSGSRSTLRDGFRFSLEARNVPTTEGKLDMEITPAVAMDQILADSYSTPQYLYPMQSTPESKEESPDDEEANDDTMHDASGKNSNVQRSIKDKQNIIIAAVLALLAVLLIIGVFLVKCLCIQRKKLKEESLRQAARAGEASDEITFRANERILSHRNDVNYCQPRDDHVSKEFHEPFYDHGQSGGVVLPKPDVLRNEGPRTPRNSLKRWSAHEASSHLVPDKSNIKTCRLSTALPTSSFQPQQSMKLTEESLMTLQQQLRLKQTGDQHDPQTCKQYSDWQRTNSGHEGSDTSPSTTLAGERRGRRASNEEGGSNASSNLALKEKQAFGWSNIDPELLEHCRKTNPVLHKDQYWV